LMVTHLITRGAVFPRLGAWLRFSEAMWKIYKILDLLTKENI